MKKRNLLIIVGAVLAVIVMAAVLVFSYINNLIAPKPLEITFATVQTAMPEGASCAGGNEDSPGVAKEFINLETDDIYVAGGPNVMPDDVWANFTFRLPLLQNSTRNLLFNGSCFFRSPDADADCVGDACFTIEEVVGYSWLKLTTIAGQSCFPDASGCTGDVVNPGYVSINTIAKCHRIIYNGPVIYELSDGHGNVYVMHATATGTPDVTGPSLPVGWTLREREISEPLVLLPFGGGDDCYYNVVRDNLVQAYHQYAFADAQYPPATS